VEGCQDSSLVQFNLEKRHKTALSSAAKIRGTPLEHPLGKNLVLVDSKVVLGYGSRRRLSNHNRELTTR
jgi:hypothetical protein